MTDAVQLIKDKISIVDVVSKYVQLQPAGKHMKARCPFHSEKTPSFTISPDRGMFYCYGCSKGGDIFSFIEEIEGLDFKGALKQLAEQAGVELVAEDPEKKSQRDRQYDVLDAAASYWQTALASQAEATAYLHDRGVKPNTIGAWRIGYAPGPPVGGWRDTKQHLRNNEYTEPELEAAGLIKSSGGGKESYDVFRHRVMFPLFDPAGRIVGFSGRYLGNEKEVPKYVNSPETDLYQKSQLLYGYDKAKSGIRTYDFTLIVEGQFDVVMSHQAGYTNTVAVSGTALTMHHVQLLQRLSNRVVLALDGDSAGVTAVKRSALVMLKRGMDVKVARLPKDQDPADCIVADLAKFKRAIATAAHVIEFLLTILRAEHSDDRAYKLAVREEVLPFVIVIPNHIDQEHFIGVIAKHIEVSKAALLTELARLRKEEPETPAASAQVTNTQASSTETKPVEGHERIEQHNYMYGQLLAYLEVLPPASRPVLESWLQEVTGVSVAEAKKNVSEKVQNETRFTIEEQTQKIPKVQLFADVAHTMTKFAELQYRQQLQKLRKDLQSTQTNNVEEVQRKMSVVHKHIGEMNYSPEALQEAKV